jgi:heme-degrading monooxygenase HmoA
MPVLEVTQLRLRGLSAHDPLLLESLSIVRGKLHTKSQFYTCIEDPTTLYILGIWRDLQQHQDFLASPARDEVLGPQEDMLDFQWTVHIEVEGMSSLPLDAPVLAIERLSVPEDCVDAFEQAAARNLGNNPFKVAQGWRCDTAAGSHEALIISGWEHAQAHVSFTARQKRHGDREHGPYEELLVHHAVNLEPKET